MQIPTIAVVDVIAPGRESVNYCAAAKFCTTFTGSGVKLEGGKAGALHLDDSHLVWIGKCDVRFDEVYMYMLVKLCRQLFREMTESFRHFVKGPFHSVIL